MRSKPLARLLCLLGALTVSACSLLLDFDQEGLPCSDGRCLEGYGCVEGKCVKGAPTDLCGGCGLTERCAPESRQCLPISCAGRKCGVGQRCEDASGQALCLRIEPPELGRLCETDEQCALDASGRVCMLGTVRSPVTGAPAKGVCVQACGIITPCAVGTRCERFVLGLDSGAVSLCVPENTFYACVNESSCQDHGGLVCTVFDHPDIGPISLCDDGLGQGALRGQACAQQPDAGDGGSLCRNGLCLPQANTEQADSECVELCDQSTCPSSELCGLAEFKLVGSSIRHVPVCMPQATHCLDCTSGVSACGIDAPRCEDTSSGPRCLSGCSPDAGGSLCPSTQLCAPLDGGYLCLPSSLACP